MSDTERVRLDRWLWAARFFKTRAAAKKALDAGKVVCEGQRAKPSREVGPGIQLVIGHGPTQQTLVVTGVAERRGNATAAARLYRETPDSIARRNAAATQLHLDGLGLQSPSSRPDRRDRRALKRLKQFVPERGAP